MFNFSNNRSNNKVTYRTVDDTEFTKVVDFLTENGRQFSSTSDACAFLIRRGWSPKNISRVLEQKDGRALRDQHIAQVKAKVESGQYAKLGLQVIPETTDDHDQE